MTQSKKLKKLYAWRRSYGDGELTDDSVLWIKGEPTDCYVSQASGVYYAYVDGKEVYMADTLKEAKEFILQELGI